MRLRGLLQGFAAFLSLGAVSLGAEPVAMAQPAGNVVVIGDSYAANPDNQRHWAAKIPGADGSSFLADYPSNGACLQSPDNYPRQLAARTGLNVADWSCAGLTSWSSIGMVQKAIARGDINPQTRSVVLAVGFNNHWPSNTRASGTGFDFGRIGDRYVADMHAAAAKIREVAPHTKIIIAGMLAMSEPNGAQRFCLINVVPNAPLGIPVPLLQQVENNTRNFQERAAREIGATFVDIKTASASHNTCAKDSERWVSGLVDTTTTHYNMPYHPSRAGSGFVAQELAKVT